MYGLCDPRGILQVLNISHTDIFSEAHLISGKVLINIPKILIIPLRIHIPDVFIIEQNPSLIIMQKSVDHFRQCRFSASVITQNADDLPFFNFQADVTDCRAVRIRIGVRHMVHYYLIKRLHPFFPAYFWRRLIMLQFFITVSHSISEKILKFLNDFHFLINVFRQKIDQLFHTPLKRAHKPRQKDGLPGRNHINRK